MELEIKVLDDKFHVTWHNISAQISTSNICIGHLGCKLLSTINNIPPKLISHWDQKIGKHWKSKKDSKSKLAMALEKAIQDSGQNGAILWDTMRTGSDYWRPGKLLSDVVEEMNEQYKVSYSREDFLCPGKELLSKFMNSDMSFGEYAEQYAQYLRTGNILYVGMAHVLLGLAKHELPVFYCVDPYIPDYANPKELFSNMPYKERYWLPEIPKEGCHRIILVEEIVKKIAEYDVAVNVFEVDSTRQISHKREYKKGI